MYYQPNQTEIWRGQQQGFYAYSECLRHGCSRDGTIGGICGYHAAESNESTKQLKKKNRKS